MILEPATRVVGKPATYSGDVFAYSLPGGFAKAAAWAGQAVATSAQTGTIAAERDRERTLIVTDVACDLPAEWLAGQRVLVLPVKLRFDSRSRCDAGEARAAIEFFRRDLDQVGSQVQALPLSAAGTQDFIVERLLSDTDFVVDISLASHRGNGYMNSLSAAQNLMLQHGRTRRQAGLTRPFRMWVIDSTTAFNGQGVLVDESIRALHDGMSVPRMVQHIDTLRKHVHTLAIPRNTSFFHRHSHLEGDAALNWLSFGMGKVLDRTPIVLAQANTLLTVAQVRGHEAAVARALAATTQHLRADLLAPCVCVSYAGDIAEVRQWPAFADLEDACVGHGVTLHLATMSMTNALTIGVGGVTIALATESVSI